MNYKKMEKLTMQNLSANFDGLTQKTKKMAQSIKTFELKLKNETSQDVTLALSKGTFGSLAEIQEVYPEVQGIITDGDCYEKTEDSEVKKVTAESKSNKTIKHLQTYAKRALMLIKKLDIVSLDKRNFQTAVKYTRTTPFETYGFEQRRLQNYVSTNQMDSNRAICNNVDIPVRPDALILITVCRDSEMDICMDILAEA